MSVNLIKTYNGKLCVGCKYDREGKCNMPDPTDCCNVEQITNNGKVIYQNMFKPDNDDEEMS